ncbi:unnamed protein product [Triticum turgidum subsp. durum]|uniref:LOB domain-containing protein n=1 Tax=Triticum turgidum subsp. durum TaxID=4567 RepID=A0A9R0RZR1_TRITD|nr:unnamed protein product [Triticum turgidum subsp. durum]
MTSSSAASSSHLHITITNHHHSSSVSPRSGGSGGGGGGGTTNQACAACKYQRRKCNPDCPLAPYFPADQQRRFLNAHRLFGVSNILKTLRRLKPELCDAAMQTLIYQAEMRAMDPVGGCCSMIIDLEHTSELLSAELAALQQHLDMCRQAASGVAGGDVMDGPCADLEVTSSNHQQEQLLLHADQDQVVDALYVAEEGADPVMQNGADHDDSRQPQYHGGQQQQQQQQLYDYFYYEATGAGSDEAGRKPSGSGVDINVDVMQHFDYDSSCDRTGADDQLEPMISSSLEEHYQIGQKEYEMKVASFVDVLDVRPELQAVDGKADIGIKEELQEEDPKNNDDDIALRKAAHMAESSHCRLGLGF